MNAIVNQQVTRICTVNRQERCRRLVIKQDWTVSPIQYISARIASQLAVEGDYLLTARLEADHSIRYMLEVFGEGLRRYEVKLSQIMILSFLGKHKTIADWITNHQSNSIPPAGCGWDGCFTVASKKRHERFTKLFEQMEPSPLKAMIIGNGIYAQPKHTPTNWAKAIQRNFNELFSVSACNSVVLFWDGEQQLIETVVTPLSDLPTHKLAKKQIVPPYGAQFACLVFMTKLASGSHKVVWRLFETDRPYIRKP